MGEPPSSQNRERVIGGRLQLIVEIDIFLIGVLGCKRGQIVVHAGSGEKDGP